MTTLLLIYVKGLTRSYWCNVVCVFEF